MLWRVASSHPSLWVKWIETYLIKTDSFWSVKESTSVGSWVWRKLLKYRDAAKAFYKVEIRNGRRTSFWFDNWSPMGSLFDVTGARGFIDLGIPAHSTVADALSVTRRRNHRTETLHSIQTMLTTYRDKLQNSADIPLWKDSADIYKSSFSTKKTWLQLREAGPAVDWYRGVWFTHATPKFSFFAWLAMHNRLATGDRMLSWNANVNPACVLCQAPLESRNHLFFSCNFSAEIWSALTKGLFRRNFSTNWPNIVSTISDATQQRTTLFLARYVFQSTIHSIWKERNCRRHGEQPISSAQLIQRIDKLVRNRISSIRLMGDAKYENALQTWFEARS